MPGPAPSDAELALALRLALPRLLAAPARAWLEAPPLDLPARPPRLPPDTPPTRAGTPLPPRPREWRLYSRRSLDPRAPFLLRAVLREARPWEALVEAAFQALLNRRPDPAGRAAYSRALATGALDAGVLLHDIARSAEALSREEEVRLVAAPEP